MLEFYPTQVSRQKAMAWINLVFVAGGIYGAKFMLWSASKPPKAKLTAMPGGKAPQTQANGHAASMPPQQPVMDGRTNPPNEPAELDLDI